LLLLLLLVVVVILVSFHKIRLLLVPLQERLPLKESIQRHETGSSHGRQSGKGGPFVERVAAGVEHVSLKMLGNHARAGGQWLVLGASSRDESPNFWFHADLTIVFIFEKYHGRHARRQIVIVGPFVVLLVVAVGDRCAVGCKS